MAKAKTSTPPVENQPEFEGIDPRTIAGATATAPPPQPSAQPPAPARAVEPNGAVIEVPQLQNEGGYVPRSFRRNLSSADAQTMRNLLDALLADEERLPTGKPVRDIDDALSWLLDRIRQSSPQA